MFRSTLNADIDVGVFPHTYQSGRQQWLSALDGLTIARQHLSFQCPGQGPEGELLYTDSVWLGAENAENVLVLIAGTHGIEGFTGSAVEIDFLRLQANGWLEFGQNTAVLLIHALTPWGYAWLRRCDADGVDLNRNAVDFSRPLPENPEYVQLRPVLFAADAGQRVAGCAEFSRLYGRTALEKAVSGGQYLDPSGPFYGGQGPAHGRLVCEALMQRYALKDRNLAVIDIHSGLGPYGYGEIICDHPPDSAGAAAAQQCYGDSVTLPMAGTSSSVPKLGLMDYAWHAIMNGRSSFITLEFGTYSTEQLFETLLLDHQLWARTGNHAQRLAHSRLMLNHFCPGETAWRELVLFRGRQVIGQAIRYLAA